MKFSKRLLSMVLAGALAVAASVSAFAATNTSTEITGKYQAVDIAVEVPTTGKAFINPYGLPLDTTTIGLSADTSGLQIVTAPLAVVNKSIVDLDVSAELTGAVTGDLSLSSEALASDDLGKKAFVYLQMKNHTTATDSDPDTLADEYYAAAWANTYDATKNLVLQADRTSKFETETALATIKKADTNGDAQAGGVAMFRLAGSCVKAPREPWAATDGFTATIAFTFVPAATPVP